VGPKVGSDGDRVGCGEGALLGTALGNREGLVVGIALGGSVGTELGKDDIGADEGSNVGVALSTEAWTTQVTSERTW